MVSVLQPFHDDDVSLQFANPFNGNQAKIWDLMLLVFDQTISKATGLPMEGEKWFKKGKLTRVQINWFLKAEFYTAKLGKGFPRSYLKEEWQHVLFVLQKFVTGEGCYTLTFQYQVWLLLRFESQLALNFPYFLYRSLVKMSKQAKSNPQNPLSSLHHSGLIKILVCYELEKRKDTWILFLNRNCFVFSSQDAEIISKSNSLQENDREEGLSDEDNRPLSDRLKEIIQNTLINK